MPAESAAADPNSHPPHRKGKRPKTETAPIWADCMITGQYLERDVRLENRRIFQVSSEANFRLSAFAGKIGFRLLSEKRPAPPRSFFAIFFVLLLQLHNSISHTVCARFCCASIHAGRFHSPKSYLTHHSLRSFPPLAPLVPPDFSNTFPISTQNDKVGG